jgi:hypothetical protein
MLIYAIVLIVVMIATNNDKIRSVFRGMVKKGKDAEVKEGAANE